MKIRQGFVSNSSSSSFIIGGKEVKTKDDLEYLLCDEKTDLGKACSYVDKDEPEFSDIYKHSEILDYLWKCFENIDKRHPLIIEDDFYDCGLRKFCEVDLNLFLASLDDENSYAYNLIRGNVNWNIRESNISWSDLVNSNNENASSVEGWSLNSDDVKTITDIYTKKAIKEVKSSLEYLKKQYEKNNESFKLYFVTFCTDDGESDKYDSIMRQGKVFKDTEFSIRDERS